jgi:hypothetical protein
MAVERTPPVTNHWNSLKLEKWPFTQLVEVWRRETKQGWDQNAISNYARFNAGTIGAQNKPGAIAIRTKPECITQDTKIQ